MKIWIVNLFRTDKLICSRRFAPETVLKSKDLKILNKYINQKLTWEKNAKVEEEEGGEAGTQPDHRQVEVGRVLHNGETVRDRWVKRAIRFWKINNH